MSVEKIESMEWHYLDEQAGDGIILIELRDLFKPYLLGTSYCDKITIWWDTGASEYDESVNVFAIEDMESLDGSDPVVTKVESWYDCDIVKALKYVQENLT